MPLSEENTYYKFILLGTKRTGSNYMLSLMNSHPEIVPYSEVFADKDRINWGAANKRAVPQEPKHEKHIELRDTRPIVFIKKNIYKKHPEHIKAVGFKIFYEQCQLGEQKKVWGFLEEKKHIKVIHLKRKNLLRGLVSLRIAQQYDWWVAQQTTVPDKKEITLSKFECLNYFAEISALQMAFDARFSAHRLLTVWYEDLSDDAQGTMEKVRLFLDISPHDFTASLQKQNPEPLSELITNYAELKASFQGSQWAHFFED